jgi:hypothetical protein
MLDEGVATLGVDEHTAAIIDLEGATLTVRGRGGVHWRTGVTDRTFAAGDSVSLDDLDRRTERVAPLAPTVTDADEPSTLGETVSKGGPDAALALARLVRLAQSGGAGRIDPAPIIDGVLAARELARSRSDYATADAIRDALIAGGVEINDAPGATTWTLRAE